MDEREHLERAAQIVEKQVAQTAKESAERIIKARACQSCKAESCYKSCPQYLIQSGPKGFFRWWGSTSPPDNKVKEVLPPGPSVKKGGSKSKGRKRKKVIKGLRRYVLE